MIKNKLEKWKFIWMTICVCFMVSIFSVSAYADENQTELKVQYPLENVTFRIYKIADFSEYGKFDLVEPYDAYADEIQDLENLETNTEAITTQTWMDLATTLESYIVKGKLPYDFIEKTDDNGRFVIEGIENCLVKLSKCCAPLPGDDIIGFITRGHGVSVHKKDCVNVPKNINAPEEAGRWIGAYWADDGSSSFTSTVQITGLDRDGLLADITNVLFNMRVGLHAVNARAVKGGNCVITVTLSAASVEHLSSIIAKLKKLSGVYSVERTGR